MFENDLEVKLSSALDLLNTRIRDLSPLFQDVDNLKSGINVLGDIAVALKESRDYWKSMYSAKDK